MQIEHIPAISQPRVTGPGSLSEYNNITSRPVDDELTGTTAYCPDAEDLIATPDHTQLLADPEPIDVTCGNVYPMPADEQGTTWAACDLKALLLYSKTAQEISDAGPIHPELYTQICCAIQRLGTTATHCSGEVINVQITAHERAPLPQRPSRALLDSVENAN